MGGQGRPVDCGEGREGGGLFGLVGCLGGGCKVPVSGCFVSEHCGTPVTSHPFVVNVVGMSCERVFRESI